MSRACGQRTTASYLAPGATALGALALRGDVTLAASKTFDASAAGCTVKLDGTTTRAATPPLQFGVDATPAGLYRYAANGVGIASQGLNALAVTNGQMTANAILVLGSSLYLPSIAAPSGSATYANVYADTNAGKVRLRVIFPSGAAQPIAAEP